jgi:predicted RNase H-like HicB family nuclease
VRNYRLPIIIESDADGFFVSCPSLQGCYSQGKTREEAIKNIKDAIRLHLIDRQENRELNPNSKNSANVEMVEVSV